MAADPRTQEEQQTQNQATLLKSPYIDSRSMTGLEALAGFLEVEEMEKYGVVPLSHSAYSVEVGFTDKTKKSSLDYLKQKFPQYNLNFSLISGSGFKEILDRYYQSAHKVNPEAYKQLS